MSYSAVLTDKQREQVLPITTAENVFYNGNKTIKEVVDDIINENFKTEGFTDTVSHNRINADNGFPSSSINVVENN